MTRRGPAIRARREALGLSREAVSADTRIPVAHLAAIEEGRASELPAGPYAEAWMRALEARLGLPQGDSPSAQASAPGGTSTPLWAVRGIAGAAMVVLVAAVVWRVWGGDVRSGAVEAVATEGVDQEVLIRALRTTRLTVLADGVVVREGDVAGGEEIEVRAADRIEIDAESVGALRLDYNGERIVPLGRQDLPRRLVFVDDGGGRP